MNRIEYNSQDEGDNSDSELEELFAKKTELRKKRGPNKVKAIKMPETENVILDVPITKKERTEAQKQATIKMREKLKARHDEVQRVKIETKEIVKLQQKELSLNIKKKLIKDNVNEQIELRVQERLNEIRLKAEAEAKAAKPKRIRGPPKPKVIKVEQRYPSPPPPSPPPSPPRQQYRHQSAPPARPIQTQRKALSFV